MIAVSARPRSEQRDRPEFTRSCHSWAMHAAVLVLIANLLACTPSEKKREVTAIIEGPDRIAVGESVMVVARLEYSDGSVFLTQPSANEAVDWVSSDPAVATVVSMSGPERKMGMVTGVAPGDTVITATPSPTTTGTGRRIPGTLRITVVE
jgi:hypothetical protein